MGDIISIVLLILLAILLIGPRKLPEGVEALWLTWSNFQRSQHGGAPITLDQARQRWRSEQSPFFNGIQLLYAASEHLQEMRSRMFKALIAVAICTLLVFVFSDNLFRLLLRPLDNVACVQTETLVSTLQLSQDVPITTTVRIGTDSTPVSTTVILPAGTILPVTYLKPCEKLRPIFTKPTELFITTFMVDVYAGLGLAIPFIIYQFVAFLMPALLPHEKRYVYLLLPGMTLLFVIGVVFCYLLVLPVAVGFLFSFNLDIAQPLPSINDYINFVSSLLFWVGLTFETPLIIFFLAKTRVVKLAQLKAFRRFAIVGGFVIAALITPTPDPLNQAIVALPIIILYEVGVFLARFA
ncbi:MAG: twin-arginine translocase subunit TatC [Chloroflexi bacterium]|nr:twin-arginine translocase subunit TatC [Chloroflexota bacterium]